MQGEAPDIRIRIEYNTGTLSASGFKSQAADQWNNLCSVWAKRYFLRPTQKTEAMQKSEGSYVNFETRYQEAFMSRQLRIVDSTGVYDVIEIEPLGRNHKVIFKTKNHTSHTLNS